MLHIRDHNFKGGVGEDRFLLFAHRSNLPKMKRTESIAKKTNNSPKALPFFPGVASVDEPAPTVPIVLRLPSGALLPVAMDLQETVQGLKQRVIRHCGWTADVTEQVGITLGFEAMEDSKTLLSCDVQEGDILGVYIRAAAPPALHQAAHVAGMEV